MTSTHPSTRVLEEVFASIARFAGAGACAKVIVADGVKMREGEDATCKFRSGIVHSATPSESTGTTYGASSG